MACATDSINNAPGGLGSSGRNVTQTIANHHQFNCEIHSVGCVLIFLIVYNKKRNNLFVFLLSFFLAAQHYFQIYSQNFGEADVFAQLSN